MEPPEDLSRFTNLRFDDFRRLAQDPSLSLHERIGFPNSYREGYATAIFDDIRTKLPALTLDGKRVLEIGPGCGELAFRMIELCRRHHHQLILADCKEMLAQLPDELFITKVPGLYPESAPAIRQAVDGTDVILCYSVFHYVFVDAPVGDFLDASLELLDSGGEMLVGDIPNVTKRNRLFASDAGKAFHKEFMGVDEDPELADPDGQINDAVLLDVVARVRASGSDAYLVPQPSNLPMANRREDILIRKP